jgi:hypothetical protein
MATLEQKPVTTGSEQPPATNGRWSGYARLLQMRMLELWREPEVIFWVFVFPLLLALGLGIAFRDKPADVTPIAVVEGPKAQSVIEHEPGLLVVAGKTRVRGNGEIRRRDRHRRLALRRADNGSLRTQQCCGAQQPAAQQNNMICAARQRFDASERLSYRNRTTGLTRA